jgi:hypothetical protein
MYYSYLRGKQFELLAIRNSIDKIVEANITPIIEPVRQSTRDIVKCVESLRDANANYIVVANPTCGELERNSRNAEIVIDSVINCDPEVELGFIIDDGTTLTQIFSLIENYENQRFSIIHAGRFSDFSELNERLSEVRGFNQHIFIESASSNSYRNRFSDSNRVLIRDGFNRREPNAIYREHLTEFYSDLHCNFEAMGYQGFGDFSIIGDYFMEGGGQAITAVIHITYDEDVDININHFMSEPRSIPEVVTILIEEALSGLEEFLSDRPEILEWSNSCGSLMDIYANGSNTNLANVKKFSISHHFELMHHLLN